MTPRLLTVAEAAVRLRTSEDFVRTLIAAGDLTAFPISRRRSNAATRWLITEESLDAWVCAQIDRAKAAHPSARGHLELVGRRRGVRAYTNGHAS